MGWYDSSARGIWIEPALVRRLAEILDEDTNALSCGDGTLASGVLDRIAAAIEKERKYDDLENALENIKEVLHR